ncbi:BQ2448_6849 [Microbotryum intermedium]|uniref:BQ2448_6849 protein n=1 Tax=Microbotryum intermedium TaxID=269621 RepID=A0A238FM24_9BASI|nr:BQ2448_6849 [Microbotryum intermedium]
MGVDAFDLVLNVQAPAGGPAAPGQQPPPPPPNFHQLSDGNDGLRQAKPTDRTLPSFDSISLPTFDGPTAEKLNESTQSLHALAESYKSLQEIERKLDWNVSRKRIEVQEGLGGGRVPATKRTLRVRLEIDVKDQPWRATAPQEEQAIDLADGTNASSTKDSEGDVDATADDKPKLDFVKGTGVPRFIVKVSGAVLDEPTKGPSLRRPLTTLVSRVVLDTDRDPTLHDRTGAIEWARPIPTTSTPLPVLPKALSFTIPSSQPTTFKLSLYLDHRPERFALVPELATILDMRTGDRVGVLAALWSYIKMHGLQDPDMKHIRTDDRLRKLFSGQERVPFHHLPEYTNRLLLPHPPTVITQTLSLSSTDPTLQHLAFDMPIHIENASRHELEMILRSLNAPQPLIMQLDESIAASALEAKSSHLKRAFLTAFASDPLTCLDNWLESQAEDMKVILHDGAEPRGSKGAIGGGVGWREEFRRGDKWEGEWVKEGASVWAQRSVEGRIREQVGGPSAPAPVGGAGVQAGGGRGGRR